MPKIKRCFHLTINCDQPKLVAGKLRLYSMEYCPLCHCIRLILHVKNIPHDVININLVQMPKWYMNKVNPKGKVPALDTGSVILTDHIEIANFLEKYYPLPPLYPSDFELKIRDKVLIGKMDHLIEVFWDIVLKRKKQSSVYWAQVLEPLLEGFETVLVQRNSPFYFGNYPGMVDYMLYPWAERAQAVNMALNTQIPLNLDHYKRLLKWSHDMDQLPVVEALYNSPEKFYKVTLIETKKKPPDYDNV